MQKESRSAPKNRKAKSDRFLGAAGCIIACLPFLAHSSEITPAKIADRTAIEKVYYDNRLGSKPPIEEVLTPDKIVRILQSERKKGTILRQRYNVEVTESALEDEIRRINLTTRAPQTLKQLKAALDNDETRFAETVARPDVVDRWLRGRFANDPVIHLAQRALAEKARKRLLALPEHSTISRLLETVRAISAGQSNMRLNEPQPFFLGPRPQQDGTFQNRLELAIPPSEPAKTSAQSASYEIESSLQFLQILPHPGISRHQNLPDNERNYLSDLDPRLRRILLLQLQQPGDVSALLELGQEFILFFATDRSANVLELGSLIVFKQKYKSWVEDYVLQE